MSNEEMVKELAEVEARSKSNTKRLDKLDDAVKAQHEIALSVKELATNMKSMLTELTKQGQRIEALEKVPKEEAAYYKRVIVSCVITGVISAVIGALLTTIF